jgi:hypothetical protein
VQPTFEAGVEMTDRYPKEMLNNTQVHGYGDHNNGDWYDDDNGTMPANVDRLAQAVVGRRIVNAEIVSVDLRDKDLGRVSSHLIGGDDWYLRDKQFHITLDDGTVVRMLNTDDCCAFTELRSFLLHPEKVDHVIFGVGTTERFTRWHIYADWGDVLELTVGWSCGNPFYYGYGFDIDVVAVPK